MDRIKEQSIVFIGAGNLATHLAIELYRSGYTIAQVYSRSKDSAKLLAKKVAADFIVSLKSVNKKADIYFICVPDSAIKDVLHKINIKEKLIIHTSGAIGINVFSSIHKNFGVFYPLQTFSKKRKVKFNNIPICVEANSEKNTLKLLEIASKISDKSYIINSYKRSQLHLAAVFCNNFVNHLYTIASEIIANSEIDFDLLKPLILETAKKITKNKSSEMQSGPAIRNDIITLEKHKKMLSDSTAYLKIYNLLSSSISKSKNQTRTNTCQS